MRHFVIAFGRMALWVAALHGSGGSAQDTGPDDAADRIVRSLSSSEVAVRRDAARALFESAKTTQLTTLDRVIEMTRSEKDGQVRLILFDILTRLGPEAHDAVPALVESLKTDFGGSRTEKNHQDYRAAFAMAAIGKESVPALMQLASDASLRPNVRAEAVMALGRIGEDATPAVPTLVAFLGSENQRIREDAISALKAIGQPALPALIEAARKGSVGVRADALRSVGLSDNLGTQVIGLMSESVQDPSPEIRQAAFRSLAEINFPEPKIAELIRKGIVDENGEVVKAALEALIRSPKLLVELLPELKPILLRSDEVARHGAFAVAQAGDLGVPVLFDALSAPSSPIDAVAEGLVAVGPSATPNIVASLDSPNVRVRRGAALALAAIRPLAPETPAALAKGTKSVDSEERTTFLEALGSLGPRAREVVPSVREGLKDPEPRVRLAAIRTLERCAARDDVLVSDLSGMLADADTGVQVAALESLRSLGPAGRTSMADVTRLLGSENAQVRISAAAFVASHGPASSEAVPALLRMSEHAAPDVRILAVRTLARIGKPAQPAFDRFVELAGSKDDSVREAVFEAIGSLGLDVGTVREVITAGLRDPQSPVRLAALRSVQQQGPQGSVFLPDVIRIADNAQDVRAAERALRRFERRGPDPSSVPELISLLNHENDVVKILAMRFLALAQPVSDEAVTAVEQLKTHPKESVRSKADEALRKMKGSDEKAEPVKKVPNAA